MDIDYKKTIHYIIATLIAIFLVFNFFKKAGSSCKLTAINFLLVLIFGVSYTLVFKFIANRYLNVNQSIYIVVFFILMIAVLLYLLIHYLINYIC